MTLSSTADGGADSLGKGPLTRLLVDLVGYGLVSVVALACDYGLLLVLVHYGTY